MIEKLVPIEPGVTVTRDDHNLVVARVNALIDALDAHPLRQGLDCPDCRGFGLVNIPTTGGVTTIKCPKCGGQGTVNA